LQMTSPRAYFDSIPTKQLMYRSYPATRCACSNITANRGVAVQVDLYYPICEYTNIAMPELSQFTAEFFKALAHPMRVRILDALRSGEVGVNELSARLKVEQSTLSQQLAVLRKSSIVVGRKEGQNVYYSVPDQAIFRLLDDARQVFNNHLVDIRDLLSQLSPAGEK
jgi:DNA-binding transcriptional ArsR family regulator